MPTAPWMFHVATVSALSAACGTAGVGAMIACDSSAMARRNLVVLRRRAELAVQQIRNRENQPRHRGEQRERPRTRMAYRGRRTVDEQRNEDDARREPDRRAEQEVAPADV